MPISLLSCLTFAALLGGAPTSPDSLPAMQLSLAGTWRIHLDPTGAGMADRGVDPAALWDGRIDLPGSTDEGGYGYRPRGISSLRLTRRCAYRGAAWYEREVTVPAAWAGKTIALFLERAHWQTRVWVNGQAAGSRESLSVPQRYDLTGLLRPGGKNTIRIRVDNSLIHDIGMPHAISEETQTNWNGIIGRMELQASDPVGLGALDVFPEQGQLRLRVALRNRSGGPVGGRLRFRLLPGGEPLPAQAFRLAGRADTLNLLLPLHTPLQPWDEFHPRLYSLEVSLEAGPYRDRDSIRFGLRHLEAGPEGLRINGRPLFIRANIHCAAFPLTGYPAMDKAYWARVFRICRDYGLNAMRFHTWCPPEAAFEAADECGMYLQVENADWRFNVGKDPDADRFLAAEARRILSVYGHHPSFLMFCEGNELVGPGRDSLLTALLRQWKAGDPRHLYAGSSGYPALPADDYHDLYGPRAQHWKEGLKGRLNAGPYRTDFDYSQTVATHDRPLISHEVGQWCAYPDYSLIPRYRGVLRPGNYELFRASLRSHCMEDQARAFLMASGKFQVILKKEEVEALLRTPGLGGYQLLQLQDFPGQGTAPVGVLDNFWTPKPYVDAAAFRHFQGPRVLLLRAPGFILSPDSLFRATAEIVNYGPGPMKDARVRWSLAYRNGRRLAGGAFPVQDIPAGGPHALGALAIPLDQVDSAARLDLRLQVEGSDISNTWPLWVYPSLPAPDMGALRVARRWDGDLRRALARGERVLLIADSSLFPGAGPPAFSGISWNTVWSGMPPNLLGILCDPRHPALKDFPTEEHSNWQWWDLLRHARAMDMDSLPPALRPLVQLIPDWNRNDRLGLLFEARVGEGRLLVCSMDLLRDLDRRPVARQLLYSLERYAAGPAFRPRQRLSMAQLDAFFRRRP